MMNLNLSCKRSASSSQEELDELTAMHALKRQRFATARAAAAIAAQEAALLRPNWMDMSSLYGLSVMPVGSSMFSPGIGTLGLTNALLAQQQAQAYYPAPSFLPPLAAARAVSLNNELPSRPFFADRWVASLPPGSHPTFATNQALEQLSGFAYHRSTLPMTLPPQQRARDPPATVDLSLKIGHQQEEVEEESKQGPIVCAPVNSTLSHPSPSMRNTSKLQVPELDNASKSARWDDRTVVPLSVDEDANWLSEFQCFLRSEILEVFVATPRDLETRASGGTKKKTLASTQVGIRCRFCAHLHPIERASRACAFPSSVRQIYQSFTMMLREHLSGQCQAFPDHIKQNFTRLKGQSSQGASDSKRYWKYAAQKMGMVDTADQGIQMHANGPLSAVRMKPFGACPDLEADLKQALAPGATELAVEADRSATSDFTFTVMRQAVPVHLALSEKIGNRSCLTVGLPGLACQHCARAGRSGLSRVFPARKRNLKTKVHDLYDHLRRCDLTPQHVKQKLAETLNADNEKKSKVFYTRLWRRLGHENEDGKSPQLEATRAEGIASPISSGI